VCRKEDAGIEPRRSISLVVLVLTILKGIFTINFWRQLYALCDYEERFRCSIQTSSGAQESWKLLNIIQH